MKSLKNVSMINERQKLRPRKKRISEWPKTTTSCLFMLAGQRLPMAEILSSIPDTEDTVTKCEELKTCPEHFTRKTAEGVQAILHKSTGTSWRVNLKNILSSVRLTIYWKPLRENTVSLSLVNIFYTV